MLLTDCGLEIQTCLTFYGYVTPVVLGQFLTVYKACFYHPSPNRKIIYLKRRVTEREGGRGLPPAGSFHQWPHASTGQTKAKIQEILLAFPCLWEGPKYLGSTMLLPRHSSRELDRKWRSWDMNQQ